MQISTKGLIDTNRTIAKKLLETNETPWDSLSAIKEFIISIGKDLSADLFDKIGDNIWIAKNAVISPSAFITGPCIIDEGAEIRLNAFIRGSAIVGKGAVVGNSTELKNCILCDCVQVPHFNYVGDSILGYKAHLGAGAVTSNVKSDKSPVSIRRENGRIETGLKKFGAIIGDFCEVGCNAVLCPGTVLGRNVTVYPTSLVRGYIPENSIFKSNGALFQKNI